GDSAAADGFVESVAPKAENLSRFRRDENIGQVFQSLMIHNVVDLLHKKTRGRAAPSLRIDVTLPPDRHRGLIVSPRVAVVAPEFLSRSSLREAVLVSPRIVPSGVN